MTARIGVIGCGWWATRAHLPALVANPEAVIAAIADPDDGNRRRAEERFAVPPDCSFADAASMLDNVALDAAVVAVPHAAHAPVTTMVLEHGLHTLLEKPMTIRPEDAIRLADLARERGVQLLIGYPWHYEPHAIWLRDAIADGVIGRIEFVACHYASLGRELYRGAPEHYREALGFPVNAPGQGTYADVAVAGGGQGQAQTTHVAALLCWLTGLRPIAVAAMTEAFELEVDLVNAVTIRFDGGAVASLASTGSVLPGQPEPMDVRLYGSEGSASLDIGAGRAEFVRADGTSTRFSAPSTTPHGSEWGPLDNLVDIVHGRGLNMSPASIGVMAVEIVDGMYRAARTGQTVALSAARS